ncbi:beta-galactosidase [Konateibacter massiliensis]|uniref:beta-galactosidase n=1 Tax=Konateibacter massiliensis TaxID=2002841 RepID=UPI000C15E585|nr:beta-galactosidase [Konateibacter massiliensis]
MKGIGSKKGNVWSKIGLGVCYYPEHWDKKYWQDDLRRMKELGIQTIRIAEFAWNKFEPEEGTFVFAFFDEFMEVVKQEGMKVIFGTPTATPPAWLTQKYPEVLNAAINGDLYNHGARRHYNYNSSKYRELSARIVRKLGEHYGSHPNIVGWQIDNELNCEVDVFYSESDHEAFRVYLKERYKKLEALNAAWGTNFWNQTYSDWAQIYAPRLTVNNGFNPHQKLDYIRFISESTIAFCKMQSDILREYVKEGDFITTNGMFGHLDNHKMTKECLDTYTYDSYPNFAYALNSDPQKSNNLNDRKWSKNLTEVRSVSSHFGIMEQQSGANGWNDRMEAPAPKPGQMMLWAMQSIAHGADFVSFFRWRTSCIGTEIYWQGILDYDNRDNRKTAEVKQIAERLEKIEEMAGADFFASFGLIKSYDNVWDEEADVSHQKVQSFSEQEIFCAAQLSHTPFDIIYLGDDLQENLEKLEKFPVVFYLHASIVGEGEQEVLERYVENGGILCMGCKSDYKNENGHCKMEPAPAQLRKLTGGNIREFTWVRPEEKVTLAWNEKQYEMPIFNDVLEAEEAKVLGTFGGSYYEGSPALLENNYGKGKVLHLGGVFTREIATAILEYTSVIRPFESLLAAPKDCEIVLRKKEGAHYLFVLNYSKEEQTIFLKKEMHDVDSQEAVMGEVILKSYETKVYSFPGNSVIS